MEVDAGIFASTLLNEELFCFVIFGLRCFLAPEAFLYACLISHPRMHIHTLDLDFLDLTDAVAVFVVEGPQGLALVETGPASTLPHLEAALARAGWQIADFQHVFLTHIHFDHAGAAWAFAEKGATIHVHPLGLPHLAAPDKLYNSARMIYGDDMDRLWGPMHPIPVDQLHASGHGEVVEAAGLRFTAWHTPGHAVHHVAWEVAAVEEAPVISPIVEAPPYPPVKGGSGTHSAESQEQNSSSTTIMPAPFTGGTGGLNAAIFTGDVAGVRIGGGPVMPPCPPPDIQVEDWQASIQLLRELPIETLYLTHFGAITDKEAHLDALERQLLIWAEWMRPYADQQIPAAEIVPAFQAFVQQELIAQGVDTTALQRYEIANPSYMSVSGLLRYWNKKNKK